eukprot:TRINITY_DN2170_c0_g1_i3.p1 TRINITY_DN2170_c0_g1~~TRINITY_DN2170_c0_g1_i3.p1  ORF type:complete len:298 (-),score=28.80 TRINITY_DN2170_c0_g1_i3:472-1365(-)
MQIGDDKKSAPKGSSKTQVRAFHNISVPLTPRSIRILSLSAGDQMEGMNNGVEQHEFAHQRSQFRLEEAKLLLQTGQRPVPHHSQNATFLFSSIDCPKSKSQSRWPNLCAQGDSCVHGNESLEAKNESNDVQSQIPDVVSHPAIMGVIRKPIEGRSGSSEKARNSSELALPQATASNGLLIKRKKALHKIGKRQTTAQTQKKERREALENGLQVKILPSEELPDSGGEERGKVEKVSSAFEENFNKNSWYRYANICIARRLLLQLIPSEMMETKRYQRNEEKEGGNGCASPRSTHTR